MPFGSLVRWICCDRSNLERFVQIHIIKSNQLTMHEDEPLGQGSFSKVFNGTLKQQKEEIEVAVKVPNQDSLGFDTWLEKVYVLGGSKHPNVIKYLGMNLSPPCVIMEKYINGSLRDLLGKVGYKSFSWVDRVKLTIGIARGMQFLHGQKEPIVHGNLKASNILLGKYFTPVVADHGLECFRTGDVKEGVPKPVHQAPEAGRKGEKASTKSDVYSFAIIMMEIMTGEKPLSGKRTFEENRKLIEKKRPALNENMPCDWAGWESYVDLMKRCWSEEASQRPTFTTILGELESLIHPRKCLRARLYSSLSHLCRWRSSDPFDPQIGESSMVKDSAHGKESHSQVPSTRQFGLGPSHKI